MLPPAWHELLFAQPRAEVLRNAATNDLLPGTAARLLFDAQQANATTTATILGLALALAQPTDYATAWIEGFLRSGSPLLIHYRELFDLPDAWLACRKVLSAISYPCCAEPSPTFRCPSGDRLWSWPERMPPSR